MHVSADAAGELAAGEPATREARYQLEYCHQGDHLLLSTYMLLEMSRHVRVRV